MTGRPLSIVIAGHCTIDDIHYADGQDLWGTFGGAAAYASVGAAIAGAQVSLVSLVGDDYPIARLRDALGTAVDVTGVRALPGRSIHNDAWYGEGGERRWDIESWERLEELTPTAADIQGCPPGAFVLLTPGSLWQQRELVTALASVRARIALDTELHYLDTPSRRDELLALAGSVDVFLPSIEHLELLFGGSDRDPTAYAQELQKLGCGIVAVKHGAAGSTVFDLAAGRTWRIPAVAGVVPKDSTGAGDAYGGGFVAALAAGLSSIDAACWGTVAASVIVESVGAHIPAEFDPPLVQRRLAALRPQVRELTVPVATTR